MHVEDSQERYSEYSKNGTWNRNKVDTSEAIHEYANSESFNGELYISVFEYGHDIQNHLRATGTVSGFTGNRFPNRMGIPIDIDMGAENNTEHFIQRVRTAYEAIKTEVDVNIYFSGRGMHLYVPANSFTFEASPVYHALIGDAINRMAQEMKFMFDASIYSPTGLIRCNGSFNKKSELYKIPLTEEELYLLDYNQICKLATKKRPKFPIRTLEGAGELARFCDFQDKQPAQSNPLKVTENNKIGTCIHTLYAKGPIKGKRHETVLRIASFLRRQGVPYQVAENGIQTWLGSDTIGTEWKSFSETIRSVYNNSYQYGCSDKIMLANCSTRCVFYKNKNIKSEIYTAEDMQDALIELMLTESKGRSINIGSFVKYENDDSYILRPGDMLTIFGPTGTNKTALAQNIMLGYDPNRDAFDSENIVQTLFLSLELSAEFLHKRNLQILANLTKKQMESVDIVKAAYTTYRDSLQHIKVQTTSPTIADIKARVASEKPRCLIIDYIDLIDTGKQEYEHVRHVSKELRNLATSEGFIVILLTQISRDAARSLKLDAYSAKGGGQVENSSSFVMGINNPTGDRDRPERTIELFKNTEGALSRRDLFFSPSYRLKSERTD